MSTRSGSDGREVRLFRNNRSQAVRIPVDMELPGDRAVISRDGDRLILTAVAAPTGLIDLLAAWAPIEDVLADIDDPPPRPDDMFR